MTCISIIYEDSYQCIYVQKFFVTLTSTLTREDQVGTILQLATIMVFLEPESSSRLGMTRSRVLIQSAVDPRCHMDKDLRSFVCVLCIVHNYFETTVSSSRKMRWPQLPLSQEIPSCIRPTRVMHAPSLQGFLRHKWLNFIVTLHSIHYMHVEHERLIW